MNREKKLQKMQEKAAKQHEKAYNKFISEQTKKNDIAAKKAAANGEAYESRPLPTIDEYHSKSELKAIAANEKAYAALVRKIEKKNAKLQAKSEKSGKPFVPEPIPEMDEVVAIENKKGRIAEMIILLLLIWFVVYFIIMWLSYVPTVNVINVPGNAQTTAASGDYDYEAYSNPHEITTAADYSLADAKRFLQQVIHDNWKEIGYSSDVSSSAITYANSIETVNSVECYVFTCSGVTYAVPLNLSACYYVDKGEYVPLTFNDTDILF